MRKRLIALFLALFLLAGCQSAVTPNETEQAVTYDWMAGESPVPSLRTGIAEQGIVSLANGFECTQDGVYFLCGTDSGRYLLYGDHGSDTIIKLCGRADCDHSDPECSAWFTGGSNICAYDGELYVIQSMPGGPDNQVLRIAPDGTERIPVIDTRSVSQGYGGSACAQLWNGIFSISLSRLDENGNEIGDSFYYALDGSMKELMQTDMGIPYRNAGELFLTYRIEADGTHSIFSWDPDTHQSKLLMDGVAELGTGYFGTDAAYYIRDGIICRYVYATRTEEVLFDTSLEGEKALTCFADCLIVRDHVTWEQNLAGEGKPVLNFDIYNWNFEHLGRVEIDYPRDKGNSYVICGETRDRIILTDSAQCIPRYYIEKSDFGTENIEIHEYDLPDFEVETEIINDDNF